MSPNKSSAAAPHRSTAKRVLLTFLIVILIAAAVLAAVTWYLYRHAGPILKARVIETLETNFHGKVELDTFNVYLLNGVEVSGGGLRIYAPADMVAAGATAPIFTVANFSFHSPIRALFEHPTRVHTVQVSGLEIRIPPREQRKASAGAPHQVHRIEITVDQIDCTDSRLVLDSSHPGKAPKHFELKHILLKNVGRGVPLNYEATLINAVPTGEVHATGSFGPWNPESPGDSSVAGAYRFDHADLSTIKGIGGTLASTGNFTGQLNKIIVDGSASVPDFSLDTANHAMPLSTTFHAIVDGLTGDTYLQPVHATLGRSDFTCTGSVVNQTGVGHVIDLQIHVPHGHLEDFLALAVKTRPVIMTANLGMNAILHIHPGKESVTRKLSMHSSTFSLSNIHFTNPATQDKVDELSLRAQGDPADAHAGAPDVLSHMTGQFVMNEGRLTISNLDYQMPGAEARLDGIYSLDGEQFEFAGKIRTKAKVSQMLTGWKSWVAKLADPFFHKNGAGAEIPVKISGTKEAPHFGLDFGGKEEKRLTGKTQ